VITIVVVRVGAEPVVEQIDGSLESMQAIVGGDIEYVPLKHMREVDLVCNEDGISLALKPNGCGILGTYFFTVSTDDGDPDSLDAEDIENVKNYVAKNRGVKHPTETGEAEITITSWPR
jgi:Domain of unknown function (DUF3846)